MKRLYLHIGYHKTGTTTIQQTLYANRPHLLAQGYLYPRAGLIWDGHHNLLWEVIAPQVHFEARCGGSQALMAEIAASSATNIIISSEEYSRLSGDEIRQALAPFAAFEIQVIVYLRRQDLFLQAVWLEIIKLGYPVPYFAQWLETDFFERPRLDYFATLEQWAAVVGRAALTVRPFERAEIGSNLVADFLRCLGLVDVPGLVTLPDANVSQGVKISSLMWQLGRAYRHLGQPKLLKRYQNWLRVLLSRAQKRDWPQQKVQLLTPALHEKIMAQYAASNRLVAQQYLGRETLFDEPFNPVPLTPLGLQTLTSAEIFDLMRQMMPLAAQAFEQDTSKP